MDKTKTCRVCLETFTIDGELHEFSSEISVDNEPKNAQNFMKISEVFKTLTSVPIKTEDEDETKICLQCLSDLKFCYLFQQKCWNNDEIYTSAAEPDAGNFECIEEYINDGIDDTPNDGFDTEEGMAEQQTESEDEQAEIKFEEPSSSRAIETHSQESPIKAFDSPSDFAYEDEVKESPDEIDLELHECFYCKKISVSKQEHVEHEATHDKELQDELRHECRKCQKRFKNEAMLEGHMKKFHSQEERPFNCEFCSKSFKNRYQLVLHIRSHTGEKPFTCEICNRGFSMSSNLQKHLDTHSTDKQFYCELCRNYFKTQRSLKFHTICYHQPEVKVKCPQCDKSFVNKSYLKMHMVYHRGEKNYTCTICTSKYYKTSHLKRHIQNVHFKLRPMQCEFCSGDFVRKETYRAHILSHHKRHLTEKELENVLERIKKFQTPPMEDISQFMQGARKESMIVDESDFIEEEFPVTEMEEV